MMNPNDLKWILADTSLAGIVYRSHIMQETENDDRAFLSLSLNGMETER